MIRGENLEKEGKGKKERVWVLFTPKGSSYSILLLCETLSRRTIYIKNPHFISQPTPHLRLFFSFFLYTSPLPSFFLPLFSYSLTLLDYKYYHICLPSNWTSISYHFSTSLFFFSFSFSSRVDRIFLAMEKLNFVKNGVLRLPPGFRFHPTDEELVVQYLKRKAYSCPLPASIIPEVDVCKADPWDLPG